MAQPSTPSPPTRLLVGFPPGGGVDLVARPLAQRLSERLGQQIVVENRPGANGTIAGEIVARATPDGRTLLLANSSLLTINPALYRNFPFDPVHDIAPIAQLVVTPLVLAVPAAFPAASLADFIAQARRTPGELNMGSSGNGVLGHLVLEMLNAELGLNIVHVPYRGLAPALQDLLSGRVHLMMEVFGPMRGAMQAGQLRVLAVTSARRVPELLAVPTVAEAISLPGFQATGSMGIVAPAGTPNAVIEPLQNAIARLMLEPDLPQLYAAQGLLPEFADARTYGEALARDLDRWRRVVQRVGIVVD